MSSLRIGIILGSTRPGRNGEQVARWALETAQAHGGADYELVDLADHPLHRLDERNHPSMHHYEHQHTQDWAGVVGGLDGFVFVTPEYNHSLPGALKTAIDFVYAEWNDKAAGILTYGGGAGGVRAGEHLRQILAEVQVATVRVAPAISIPADFENYTVFRPTAAHVAQLDAQLDQLLPWAEAMRDVRARKAERAAA